MKAKDVKYYSQGKIYNIVDADVDFFSINSDRFLHSFDDKPSLIIGNSSYWDYNGLQHRINGPALIETYSKGTNLQYFLYGVEYSKEQWEIEKNRIKTLEEI